VALPLADILREHWASYAQANRTCLTGVHYRAVRRVLACRTPELGGRLYQCTNTTCAKRHYAYHSCNHRNCTQCGARDQQQWTAKQEAKLLGVPYFMVTFTIPEQLRPLCLHQPKTLYHLLLKYSAQALTDVTRTKLKNGHLQLHLTSVLHTWGRQVQHHPHIHCIVPAIALDSQNGTLHRPKKPKDFLIHYGPLAARFRSLLFTALKNDHPDLFAKLTPDQRRALGPKTQWNVQLQAVGSGKTALRYLARYVQRSAFTAKRILGYDPQGRILLKWTCSTTHKVGILRLHPHEFIRRWCLHILPKGFMRVRHYGLASGAAKKSRAQVRQLLNQTPEAPPEPAEPEPFTCPHCQSELRFLRELPRPRGPPS
jgi:hypothetical protein